MMDASALLALANQRDTSRSKRLWGDLQKGNWNTLEGPQSLQMYGNGEENVMNKKEDDHSDTEVCKDNHE